MRLKATVESLNRDVNMKTKAINSLISLGKKPLAKDHQNHDPKIFMMVCTGNNLAGIKYGIRGNLKKVFDKFIDKGQCTISLINPAKDIFISKADPVQLKAFLNTMKKVLMAKTEDEIDSLPLTAAALNPASTKQVSKSKEKMSITEKKDYPITKSFPSTLKNLNITGINLKYFDKRILALSHLVVLKITDNSISTIPETFHTMPNLKELNLSNNKIKSLPIRFFHCSTIKSLLLLDLCGNQLKVLPNAISNLSKLITLNMANNELTKVGVTLDKLNQLKRLELIGNSNLKVLPGNVPKLRLDYLSLSPECLTQDDTGLKLYDNSFEIPSLMDLCIAKCSNLGFRSKLNESEVTPYILISMDTLQRCECGNFCHLSSHAKGITKTNANRIAQTFVSGGNSTGSKTFLRCETLFCSTKCLEKYKKQPLNYR